MTSSDDRPTKAMLLVGPGRVLAARYELMSTLGSGGMATVFLARDRVLDRDVAVKVLRDQFATDPTFLARFTREALDAARLSHPGLVTIFDAGVDDGTAFIAMEVVHGRTVQDLLSSEGPLPITRAVRIAADVCDVLDVAHRAGVVHRDIKPGNIALSDDGRTRVFDFGIARTSGSVGLTELSTVIGTAAYLSPEQAAGGPADPRSDLYAVGCVLVEMLTGSPPFHAETPLALLHQHVHDEPAPLSAGRPEVGAPLDALVLRLLSKDPADRPSNAAEVRRELLATLVPTASPTLILPTVDSIDTVDTVDTAVLDVGAARGRRRTMTALGVVAACVALVALVAVVLALLLQRDDGAPTSTGSPTGSPTASPESVTPTSTPIVVPVATTAAAALDALRRVITTGQSTGLIDAAAATKLMNATDDIASTVDKRKGKSAVPRIQGLADLVDSLAASGQVAPAAVAPLHAAINQLLGVLEQGD